MRIGIDVLVPKYVYAFPNEYVKHDMVYGTSTEKAIPLPDDFCDVIYSVNSLDHVKDLVKMCGELRRILKPGGHLIGSFNLDHPPDRAEPQRITEKMLKRLLFRDYDIMHWWLSAPEPLGDHYKPLWDRRFLPAGDGERYLWARAVKPL